MSEVDLTVDAKTLCNYLGVETRQLANYRKAGMPMQAANTYNVRECVAWYSDWRTQSALKANQKPVSQNEDELKLRKLEAEAIAKEIEVEQLRGGLVRVEDAERELAKHLTSVRNGLQSFPARAASFLVGINTERQVRDLLDREVVALMDYLREMAEAPEPESLNASDDDEAGDEQDE